MFCRIIRLLLYLTVGLLLKLCPRPMFSSYIRARTIQHMIGAMRP